MLNWTRLQIPLQKIAVALSLLQSACVAAAEDSVTLNLPQDLYVYGRERGCDQVANFYVENPDVRDPPFLYGLDMPRPESGRNSPQTNWHNDRSAAFWCQTHRDLQEDTYTLLLRFSDPNGAFSGCPDFIPGLDIAGGLTRINVIDRPLAQFVDALTRQPLDASPGIQVLGPGIKGSYEGMGYIFSCHNSRWILVAID